MNAFRRYRRAREWGHLSWYGCVRIALRRDWREIRLFQ